MAFRHFNNQKSTSGNHQSKGFPNSVKSAWRATLGAPIGGCDVTFQLLVFREFHSIRGFYFGI